MAFPAVPKIFAIDFEGNGREGILEFGIIRLSGEALCDPVESFCRCGRVPGIFLSQRKISLAETAAAPPIGNFFPLFREMRSAGIFAAHHAPTEDGLLRHSWPSPGFVPDWLGHSESVATWGPWLDTHGLGQIFWPRLPHHGLADTLRGIGLGEEWRRQGEHFCRRERRRPHCALYDAIGCALLLRECLRGRPGGPVALLAELSPALRQLPLL